MSRFRFCIPSMILWNREIDQIEYGTTPDVQEVFRVLQRHMTKGKIEVCGPEHENYWKLLPRAYKEEMNKEKDEWDE